MIGDLDASINKVIEEAGEVLQAIGKAKRFGWYNHHPTTLVVNLDALKSELTDLKSSIEYLEINLETIPAADDKTR